ncbi:Itga9p [Blomia tropicalis]|nr:Itga9p [Blomia tropicalis]
MFANFENYGAKSILILLTLPFVIGLNLDIKYPVEFKLPSATTSNNHHDSAHFGHSVLILQTSNRDNAFQYLVGAPNERTSVSHGGSIYRCTFVQSTNKGTCSRISARYVTKPTEEMHLGSNLVAQHNLKQQFVSCAYSKLFENVTIYNGERVFHPIGTCYQNQLNRETPIDIFEPLRNNSEMFHRIEKENRSSYYYSHAMAGFSVAFSQKENNLYLGAPGFDDWKGALIQISKSNQFNNGQKNFDHIFTLKESTRDIYLGYSIGIGQFFGTMENALTKKEYAVVGAPRVGFKGSVALVRLDEKPLKELHFYLNGTQSGEYFGSSILIVDINNDGFDDLLIGAPMYSTFKKGFSDEGRVYVYISNGKELIFIRNLYGSNKPDARFGTSMAALGDLNHDGFNDVVIGAPYEDNGHGAIYIYRGIENGISSNWSQRISASEWPTRQLFGFGFSFSSQVDIDRNGFNDLLIGSYLSNNAILLRSRPILSMQVYMKLTDEYVTLNKACTHYSLVNNAACIGISYCFDTKNFNNSYRTFVDATLIIDSMANTLNERCYIMNADNGSVTNRIKSRIEIRKQREPLCSKQFTIIMRESNQIDNFVDPIVFSLSYGLVRSQSSRVDTIFNEPVIEGQQSNITTEVYIKMCSSIARECVSRLRQQLSITIDDEDDDESEELVTGQMVELVEGLHRKVKLRIQISNFGEPAFLGKLNITINNTISLAQLDSNCQHLELSNNSTNIVCSLKSPLKEVSSIILVFNTPNTTDPVHFGFNTTIANVLKNGPIDDFVLFRQIIYPASLGPGPQLSKIVLPMNILNLNNRIPVTCEPVTMYNIVDWEVGGQFAIHKLINNSKIINMECDNSNFVCENIQCYIGPITWQELSSFIKLHSNLVMKDKDRPIFGDIEYEKIVYNVRMIVSIMDKNIESDSNRILTKNIRFTFKPVDPILDEPIPIWTFIIGIIIGLLLLLLLLIILYKCGFFNRTVKENAAKPFEDELNE